MARPSFLSILLILALTPAVASGQEPATLTGRVVDATTGAGVFAASIRIPELGRSAVSDLDGQFRLEAVPAGTLIALVSRIGYEAAGARWEIGADGGRVEVPLRPNVVVLEGLRVAANQLRARREASGFAVQAFEQAELMSGGEATLGAFLAERAQLHPSICGLYAMDNSPDCVAVRGTLIKPCITIDETRSWGGVQDLSLLTPGQVHSVDVIAGGRYVQVYTVGFMRMKAGRRWRPASMETVIARACRDVANLR